MMEATLSMPTIHTLLHATICDLQAAQNRAGHHSRTEAQGGLAGAWLAYAWLGWSEPRLLGIL